MRLGSNSSVAKKFLILWWAWGIIWISLKPQKKSNLYIFTWRTFKRIFFYSIDSSWNIETGIQEANKPNVYEGPSERLKCKSLFMNLCIIITSRQTETAEKEEKLFS